LVDFDDLELAREPSVWHGHRATQRWQMPRLGLPPENLPQALTVLSVLLEIFFHFWHPESRLPKTLL
jgi:hypothetical protein